MPPNEAFEIVHRYSDLALQLDSTLAAGYVAKASAYLIYDWNWDKAYDALQQAIKLNPATTEAHQLLSFYYMITAQRKEAVEVMEQAFRMDPLSIMVNKSLTDAYFNAGRTDDALRQAEYLFDLHPQMLVTRELRGWAFGNKGDWKKAAEIFEENYRLLYKHPLKGQFPLGVAYGNSGETEKALECIRKIEQWQREEPGLVLDADLAMIWLSLGDVDKGFHHLFQCVERKMGPVAIIIEFPTFKVPKYDPRFRLLKEMLGLAEYL